MSYTTPQDINVLITVLSDSHPTTSNTNTNTNTNTTSSTSPSPQYLIRTERRITPTWSITHLKQKLEPITGIPATSQTITHIPPHSPTPIPLGPDTALLSAPQFNIARDSELRVTDTRPPAARTNLLDVSSVPKYEMSSDAYSRRDDSVLAWKRRVGLGRFDPSAKAKSAGVLVAERREGDQRVVRERGVEVGKRCRVNREDERRGVVRFVGEIVGLGGAREEGCVWVGVELDEPVGRNDGSVVVTVTVTGTVDVDGDGEGGGDGKMETRTETKTEKRRVFECAEKFGVFVRPEKVEVGEWPVLDDLGVDEDMEEL